MESLFEEDDEAFDLKAVEARHAEMEAEALLDAQEAGVNGPAGEGAGEHGAAGGIFPESDWEAIVESVLFTMGNSVELRQLAVAIDQSEAVAKRVVERLMERYARENRGMQVIALEGSYQMCTRAEFYENLIRVAATPKKHVLTEVVLETLSIIAYKQPVTKMEISKIRGVSSDHAVNRLVEYGLVYEVGRLDAPGRPALFATTEEFLRRFGVGSTTDLPTVNPEQEEEILQEVEEELQMKLGEAPAETDAEAGGEPGTDVEAGGEPGADAEEGGEPGADVESGGEPGTVGEAGKEPGTDVESDGEPGANVEEGGELGADVEAVGEPGTDVKPDGEPGMDVEAVGEPGADVGPDGEPGTDMEAGSEPGADVEPGGQPETDGISADE